MAESAVGSRVPSAAFAALLAASSTTSLDGKDAPITGNHPNADMIAVKRIDSNTVEMVSKEGGKVTTTSKNAVSPTAGRSALSRGARV